MTKKMTMKLAPKKLVLKRLVAVLGTLGFACLGAHAEQAPPPAAERGKMIDRSQSRPEGLPSSSERESAQFKSIDGSSLSRVERKTILEAAPPLEPARRTVTMDDLVSGTNFDSGKASLLPAALQRLDQLAAQLRGKQKLRFQIVGHTDNQRIAARLKPIFPTNQALSEARALAVAQYLMRALNLEASAFAASGKGETEPVASNATLDGMARNRRTEIRVWFEEVVESAPGAPQPPRQVEKLITQDSCAALAKQDAPFSISVDGVPIEADTTLQEADRQRCVDVALEKAAIQIKYDPLNVSAALNVWLAAPYAVRGEAVRFGSYANYAFWIKRAEIRIFAAGQSTQETPLAVIPLSVGSFAEWQAPAGMLENMGYLLRVYDDKGRFDETRVHPLRLLDQAPVQQTLLRKRQDVALAGWGQSSLRLHNIGAAGGTVTVSGDRVQQGSSVTAMGILVPVDEQGRFALRQIMPPGAHTVEIALKDRKGEGMTFRRNLLVASQDWFYVALADLTVGRDRTIGPAQIVTNDLTHYKNETWADGRGAFYLKGKIKGEYLLTASADTREQPLRDLFHNFQNKDPNYLLRRIDPDKYYPVYGDDSTTVDDAPTQGRMYVRIEKGDSSVMWGNFQTAWTGAELAQYSRGLYGANLLWNSDGATPYGEKQASANVFAASPGTLQSREEFRGTGGSQYYLRHLDLTQGSERLWVEVRDKDSGLVIQRTPLSPSQDYEINYLQGRVTLRSPLSSVTDGSSLVQTSSLSGNPQYLIATYEYVPGLSAISGSTVGARGNYWINEHLRLGASHFHQGEDDADQTLKELDAILRYKPGTWLKAELARSEGAGSTSLSSISGGYDFVRQNVSGAPANARRVDMALDLADFGRKSGGRFAAYWQNREAGFSGPGMMTATGEAMKQAGAAAALPLTGNTELALKADDRTAPSQDARAAEVSLRHKINAEWGISGGVRHDLRDNNGRVLNDLALGRIRNASPTLSQEGSRSDMIVRVDYRPLKDGQEAGDGALEAVDSAKAAPAGGGLRGGVTAPLANAGREARFANGAQLAPDATAAAGIAAARVAGMAYAPWDMYGFAQHTLSRSGTLPDNDRIGLGGSRQVGEKVRLGAEVSGGDGGAGGQLFGNYQLDDRSTLYLNYRSETETPDINYTGRMSSLTAGGRYRLNDQAALFTESRWGAGAGPQSLTHAFGVDLAPGERWTTGLKFETGKLSNDQSGDLKRDAIGITAAYSFNRLKFTSALEYRTDHTISLGTLPGGCATRGPDGSCDSGPSNDKREVWLTRNSLTYQLDRDWRLLGKLNLSRATASKGAFYDGDYTEVVGGAAYRPVDNDRWNTLVKYTYFYNLPTAGQVDRATGGTLDYMQKSNIFNIDTIYDAAPWLSVGVKYGLRVGKLRASRTEGEWFSSRADLVVLRADLHWVHEWDAIVEARRLDAREAADARSGFLVGVYRHVAKNAKVGIGYNFTNFSDDLTDMSYRSRGWFLNAISTF